MAHYRRDRDCAVRFGSQVAGRAVRDRVDLIVIHVGKDVDELRGGVDLSQDLLGEDRAVLHLERDRQVVRAAELL